MTCEIASFEICGQYFDVFWLVICGKMPYMKLSFCKKRWHKFCTIMYILFCHKETAKIIEGCICYKVFKFVNFRENINLVYKSILRFWKFVLLINILKVLLVNQLSPDGTRAFSSLWIDSTIWSEVEFSTYLNLFFFLGGSRTDMIGIEFLDCKLL